MLGNLFDNDDELAIAALTGTSFSSQDVGPPRPRSGTKLAGIANQGATGYLNSLLQTLLLTPEFREALFKLPERELGYLEDRGERGSKVRVIPLQLQRLFARLLLLDQQSVSTEELTESFGWTNNEQFQQQDVQELNRILFSAIEDSLSGTSGHSLIKQLYHGNIVNQIICEECGKVSEREEDFLDLTLSISGVNSLESCLSSSYCDMELMDGKNQYRCDRCQKLVNARKGAKIRALPQILTISLLRFSYDFQQMKRFKETGKFTFPLLLNMAPYVEKVSSSEEEEFELFSVVIHRGGAYGGHYFAYIRDIDNLGHWVNPGKVDVEVVSLKKTGEVELIKTNSPSELIQIILEKIPSHALPVDQLGDEINKQTGVTWNKRFKKHHGTLTKFLSECEGDIVYYPHTRWVYLVDALPTGNETSHPTETESVDPDTAENITTSTEDGAEHRKTNSSKRPRELKSCEVVSLKKTGEVELIKTNSPSELIQIILEKIPSHALPVDQLGDEINKQTGVTWNKRFKKHHGTLTKFLSECEGDIVYYPHIRWVYLVDALPTGNETSHPTETESVDPDTAENITTSTEDGAEHRKTNSSKRPRELKSCEVVSLKKTGEVELIKTNSPSELIQIILEKIPSHALPVDQLGDEINKQTGVTWNKRFKKHHGTLTKFLSECEGDIVYYPHTHWVYLVDALPTGNETSHPTETDSKRPRELKSCEVVSLKKTGEVELIKTNSPSELIQIILEKIPSHALPVDQLGDEINKQTGVTWNKRFKKHHGTLTKFLSECEGDIVYYPHTHWVYLVDALPTGNETSHPTETESVDPDTAENITTSTEDGAEHRKTNSSKRPRELKSSEVVSLKKTGEVELIKTNSPSELIQIILEKIPSHALPVDQLGDEINKQTGVTWNKRFKKHHGTLTKFLSECEGDIVYYPHTRWVYLVDALPTGNETSHPTETESVDPDTAENITTSTEDGAEHRKTNSSKRPRELKSCEVVSLKKTGEVELIKTNSPSELIQIILEKIPSHALPVDQLGDEINKQTGVTWNKRFKKHHGTLTKFLSECEGDIVYYPHTRWVYLVDALPTGNETSHPTETESVDPDTAENITTSTEDGAEHRKTNSSKRPRELKSCEVVSLKKTGEVELIKTNSPSELIQIILEKIPSHALPVDQLGDEINKQTGVTWNKRFKKHHGTLTKFLSECEGDIVYYPHARWVYLVDALPTGNETSHPTETESVDPDTAENITTSTEDGAEHRKTNRRSNSPDPPPEGFQWFNFDDSRVSPIHQSEIERHFQGRDSAYMLFYRRKQAPRPSDAFQNPVYAMPDSLVTTVLSENDAIFRQREEYEARINMVTIQLHAGDDYHYKDGALKLLHVGPSFTELTIDRRKRVGDLLEMVQEVMGSRVPDPLTLHRLQELPAGLHLYDSVSEEKESFLISQNIDSSTKLFVWDGQQVNNSSIPVGFECEPIYLTILYGNMSQYSCGYPKDITLGEFRSSLCALTDISDSNLKLDKVVCAESSQLKSLCNDDVTLPLAVLGFHDGDTIVASDKRLKR